MVSTSRQVVEGRSASDQVRRLDGNAPYRDDVTLGYTTVRRVVDVGDKEALDGFQAAIVDPNAAL